MPNLLELEDWNGKSNLDGACLSKIIILITL